MPEMWPLPHDASLWESRLVSNANVVGIVACAGLIFGVVTGLTIVYLFLSLLDRTLSHRREEPD